MNPVIISVLVVGGTGLLIGFLLGIAGKKFEVKTDERIEAVRDALPGNNCGGCGFPGCDGCAEAIVKGAAPVNACPVGGAPVAREIGAIMGEEVKETARMTAFVRCGGTCEKTRKKYEYTGVEDCSMMAYVPGGGPKLCEHGCLGYGNCVKACQFDAIHIVNGVASVDRENCKACGACVKACPRGLIEMIPYEGGLCHVQCASPDKGKTVMDSCDVGCIGCRKCEKNCPSGAITVSGSLAHVDSSLCTGCGICMEVCPRGCIIRA
jgi:electron transport complex protein RnfB